MASFGEELRRERELRDISLSEVAEATKISVRFLEAIERNDFESLPGGVYNRGIVRAYCQFIGADPEAMVNAYLLEVQTRVEPATSPPVGLLRGGRSATTAATATNTVNRPAPVRRPAVPWILLGLIVAALVACILLYIRFSGGGAGTSGSGAPVL